MGKLQDIKTEIDADPLTRGYSGMSDSAVAVDMNTLYRPADGGIPDVVQYVAENKSRTNNGTDTTSVPILWRLDRVAQGAVGVDVFGSGHNLTKDDVSAAHAFQKMIESPQLETVNFTDTEISNLLDDLSTAQILKAADITAIKGFSENKQSRATELFLGRIREGDVTAARALP